MNKKALISSTEGARQRLALLREDFQNYIQYLKDSGMVESARLVEKHLDDFDNILLEVYFTINPDSQRADIIKIASDAAVHGNPISE